MANYQEKSHETLKFLIEGHYIVLFLVKFKNNFYLCRKSTI